MTISQLCDGWKTKWGNEWFNRDLAAKTQVLVDSGIPRQELCSESMIPIVEDFWNDSHVRATLEEAQLGPSPPCSRARGGPPPPDGRSCFHLYSCSHNFFRLDHSDQ